MVKPHSFYTLNPQKISVKGAGVHTPTTQAKAFAHLTANREIHWGSRTSVYPIKHR
jgi:hypothetical protein